MTYNLTPSRTVGDDAICDRNGPKLWATGTRTGENKGIAELASCDIKKEIFVNLETIQKRLSNSRQFRMIEILFNMHASKNKHVRSYHYAAKENIYRDVKEFKIEAAVK